MRTGIHRFEPHAFGGVCDRCGTPFLIGSFPHNCICPGCNPDTTKFTVRTGSRVTS